MSEDIADGELINVSGLSLAEPLTEAEESALARALNRLLVSGADGACNGFNASI